MIRLVLLSFFSATMIALPAHAIGSEVSFLCASVDTSTKPYFVFDVTIAQTGETPLLAPGNFKKDGRSLTIKAVKYESYASVGEEFGAQPELIKNCQPKKQHEAGINIHSDDEPEETLLSFSCQDDGDHGYGSLKILNTFLLAKGTFEFPREAVFYSQFGIPEDDKTIEVICRSK